MSAALPIGAFAYSQGLEQAVASGAVPDAESTRALDRGHPRRARCLCLDVPVFAADLPRCLDATKLDHALARERWKLDELLRRARQRVSCAPKSASSAQPLASLARGAQGVARPRPSASKPTLVTLASAVCALAARALSRAQARGARLRVLPGREAQVGAATRLIPLGQSRRAARAARAIAVPRPPDVDAALARSRRRARLDRARPGARFRCSTKLNTAASFVPRPLEELFEQAT